jgi:hypothetical protein
MSDAELRYGQLKLSKEQEERIWEMNPEQIKEYMHELAVEQGLAMPDTMNPSLLLPVAEPAAAVVKEVPATQEFTSTETIGGKDFTFTADSQAELDRAIANAYRVAMEIAPPTAQSRDANGRFASSSAVADEIAERARLDVEFRNGLIDAATYIEKTGAIGEYLEERGVSIEDLKQQQAANYEKSWKEASAEFIRTTEGAKWPGGQKNLEILGRTLVSMGLQDTEDKVGALVAAYQEMQRAGIVFPTELAAGSTAFKTGDVDETAFAAAKTPEELRALAHKAVGMDPRISTTGLWGAR